MMHIRPQRKRQMIIAFLVIPLLLNYYFWLSSFPPSYALSEIFEKTFWVVSPIVSLFAFTQVESSNYLPSLNKLGFPWQISYFVEKVLHLVCCMVGISSFLLLLSALLIRGAPSEYKTVRVARLEQSRLNSYRYSWQIASPDEYLRGKDFLTTEKQYQFLDANRGRNINIRVQHNIAGSAVTIVK